MTLNLKKYERTLLSTWQGLTKKPEVGKWSLYGYEGKTFDLMPIGHGDDGLEEMKEDLSDGRMMYAGIVIQDPNTRLPKIVFIQWQGLGVPEQIRGKVAVFSNQIQQFFKGFHIQIIARSEDELEKSVVEKKVASASGANYSVHKETKKVDEKQSHPVAGYKKVDPTAEIQAASKTGFWNKEAEENKAQDKKKLTASEKRIAELAKLKAQTPIKQETDTPSNSLEEIRLARQKELQELSGKKVANESNQTSGTIGASYKKVDPKAELSAVKSRSPASSQEKVSASSEKNEQVKRPIGKIAAPTFLNKQKEPEVPRQQPQSKKLNPSLKQNIESKIGNLQFQTPTEEPVEPKLPKPIISPDTTANSGVSVVAIFDYDAQEDNQISFREGDEITNVNTKSENGWWVGTGPDGRTGKIPSNYVEIKSDSSYTVPTSTQEPIETVSNYEDEPEQEPEPEPEQEEPEPQQEEALPTEHDVPSSNDDNQYIGPQQAVVLYDYDAADADEMTVFTGDQLTVLETRDDGWWLVENQEGITGLVPSNYLEIV